VTGRARACVDGQAHGVLLMNSNGMDVVLQPTSASFRVIGGVLDLYVLAGPTPLAVLEQLTAIIGRPMMVPAWSLGLMNSKWGPAPALAAPQGPDAGQRRAAGPRCLTLLPAGARYGYTSAAQSAMVRNGYANASIPLCAPGACR